MNAAHLARLRKLHVSPPTTEPPIAESVVRQLIASGSTQVRARSWSVGRSACNESALRLFAFSAARRTPSRLAMQCACARDCHCGLQERLAQFLTPLINSEVYTGGSSAASLEADPRFLAHAVG